VTVPGAAAAVFGDRLPLAERFVAWLIGPGITRGLLGPREADQIWERHVLNGVGIGGLIAPGSVVVDLGSGAGLPGLPLLLARPDLHLVLVEPKARRAEFLREVCADLGLTQRPGEARTIVAGVGSARVVRARATPAGLAILPDGAVDEPVPPADVVTARAVASLADLGRWAAPLLREGGRLVAVKGASAPAELERDRGVLAKLGFREIRLVAVEAEQASPDGGTEDSPDRDEPPAATVVAMTLNQVSRET